MLFISSVCAVIASALMYRIPRERWLLFSEKVIVQIRYFVLGIREVPSDIVNAKYNITDYPSQTGRIALVTGGSRGIGVEVVRKFLELDMEVIIACRTPAAGEKTVQQIRESGVNTGKAKVYKLDNASLESVRQFAAEIKRDYKQLHVLINNAGIMFWPYEKTVDDFEQQWGVNYLSHFLLTILLLPLLKAGGLPQKCSRIVNVTSCAHLLGKINFNDINSDKDKFVTENAYSQSKLAQAIFTRKLQNLFQEKKYNVQAYCVHPGIVLTELFVHSFLWKLRRVLRFLKGPKEGAIPLVYTAISEAIENSGGVYISNCRPSPVNPDVLNPSIQDKLMELSLQQVKLDNNILQYI